MRNIPRNIAHSKPLRACSPRESIRQRLAALAYAATTQKPTFAGWCVLHTAWLEIEPECQSAELRAEHRRVDQLLGGRAMGSDPQNVKGQFSGGSLPENCCEAGALDRQTTEKIDLPFGQVRRFARCPKGCPSGERAVSVAVRPRR